MKIKAFYLALIILLLLSGCQEEIPSALISGFIPDNPETEIWIDGQAIEISDAGEFTWNKNLEQFTLLDLSYGKLEWTLFLSPGAHIEIHIKGDKLQSIEYKGDLSPCNTYLLSTSSLTGEINSYFNQNWASIHQLDQAAFLATTDSLKGLYIKHLEQEKAKESFAPEFLEAWLAEIDYSFSALLLRYPERYMLFPPKLVTLDDHSMEYIKGSDPDRFEYFSLPGYKNYTRAWIDYHSNLLAENDTSERHFGLKRMDHLFQFISSSFENSFLQDYWKSEYLVEHMEETRLSNSQPYLELFLQHAVSESEIARVLKTRSSLEEENQDHSLSVYKQENGFKLEAHLFTPRVNSIQKQAAIVIFHGGGWNSGNPSWGFDRARHFAENGMLAVAAQYRLGNKHDITAVESMADARDLVIWLRKHADSLHIDSHKIVGYGWSAGAHLISSAAIFPQTDLDTGISSAPDALVLLSPAVSLPRGEGWKYWTYNVLGTKATVDEVDPAEHVKRGLPPTIILQGKDDTVTPLDGVQLFSERMIDQGNHCELWVYDGVGHLFTPNYLPDNGWPRPDQEVQKKAFSQIDVFLQDQGFMN